MPSLRQNPHPGPSPPRRTPHQRTIRHAPRRHPPRTQNPMARAALQPAGMSSSGGHMTLEELISQLTETDDGLTVYASEPWSAHSDAMAVSNRDGTTRPDAEGRTYLLETVLIRDVLETWSSHHGGATPSPQEACQAVIYYAENDAYLFPDDGVTRTALPAHSAASLSPPPTGTTLSLPLTPSRRRVAPRVPAAAGDQPRWSGDRRAHRPQTTTATNTRSAAWSPASGEQSCWRAAPSRAQFAAKPEPQPCYDPPTGDNRTKGWLKPSSQALGHCGREGGRDAARQSPSPPSDERSRLRGCSTPPRCRVWASAFR